jgi:ABC-type multidrug transport system fused ATPase/permease subunit
MDSRGTGGRWLRRLESQFLRPYRLRVGLALLGLFVQSLLLLPIPLLQGWVLDRLLRHGGSSAATAGASRAIVIGLIATVACHLARMAIAWKVTNAVGRISQEVVVALRGALHRKLLRLPMVYFDNQQTGRLMARVTSDVGSILAFLNVGSLQLVNDLILALGIAVVLISMQWSLGLVALATVPLYAVNQRLFSQKIFSLSTEIRGQIAAIYALLSERVSAVRVVRAFAKEDTELAALDERIDTHRGLSWANTRANAALTALATLISGLGTVFVLYYGAVLVARGRMSAGELVAFYAFIGQLYNPIARLTQFQATAVAMQVSVERLFEVFDEPEPIADHPGATAVRGPRGALELRDVRFSYAAHGAAVLDGIDLAVEPGTTLGIFGASGSGKSTLLSLIPRLYSLADGQGTVLLDGRDIRWLELAGLRRAVALVPQHAVLFEGTVRSNLLYAAPDATDAQIRRALIAADFAATVDAMPLGLDSPVGERGFSLSGGQRQRLALARALVADPAVLLLDDCTSALDAESETRVRAGIRSLSTHRTCVVVSHKTASLASADHIIVLDGGTIVEAGTHEELLALGGRYADAHQYQSRILDFRPVHSALPAEAEAEAGMQFVMR